jgi:hypothetical protein
MIQVSQKELFGHDSYTAGYLMRDLFPQPDTTILATQLNLYNEQLKLMDSFFSSLENGNPLNTEDYKKDFYVSTPRNKCP